MPSLLSSAVSAVTCFFANDAKHLHPPTKLVTPMGKYCIGAPHRFDAKCKRSPFNVDWAWMKCRHCDHWEMRRNDGGAA